MINWYTSASLYEVLGSFTSTGENQTTNAGCEVNSKRGRLESQVELGVLPGDGRQKLSFQVVALGRLYDCTGGSSWAAPMKEVIQTSTE